MTARPFLLAALLPLAACATVTPAPSQAPSSPVPTAAYSTMPASDLSAAPSESPVSESSIPSSVSSTPDMQQTTVLIQTSLGDITVKFFPDKAPKHVANFISLAQRGVYDGTLFHRVIPGFMIQGGDPKTKDPKTPREQMGTGSATDPSGKEIRVPAEFNDTPHKRGVLSMARSSDPNSASSQFFIVVADSSFLDGQYTVFGEVTTGMDVADKIVAVERDARDNPLEPVKIVKMVVSEK